jgi:hypothetical protein
MCQGASIVRVAHFDTIGCRAPAELSTSSLKISDRVRRNASRRHDDIDREPDQLGGERRQPVELALPLQ